MSDKYLGGCAEASEFYNVKHECCSSCHTDHDEDGYDLCYQEHGEGYFHVCCNMALNCRQVVEAKYE